MGKFEEAVICCRRHLEICQEHGDRVGEGRALYNLGNVYHAKGKHIGRLGHQDPGEFPEEVKALFEKAVQYYEENMVLMEEISDRAAQGRACGNLGNVHYLLGNFAKAIFYHQERLKIAKEFGDRAAERRAHSNLGNAHIFLGEFEKAAEHYKRTLMLAQELDDRAVEAQACYSLGNTYTLLKDYPTAVECHLRHLRIAQELFDKVGEGRACWSLGNAHSAMGQHKEAYHYAAKHLEISKETGDRMGQATAQLNIAELARTLGYPEDTARPPTSPTVDKRPNRRISMEHMDLLKMTPDVKSRQQVNGGGDVKKQQAQPPQTGARSKDSSASLNKSGLLDEEDFFDFISRFQSKRMDDQRCSLAMPNAAAAAAANSGGANNQQAPPKPKAQQPSGGAAAAPLTAQQPGKGNDLLDKLVAAQPPQQPPQFGFLPGLPKAKQPEILQRLSVATKNDESFPDDTFFEMLMKCQGTRIEDQRSSLPLEGGVGGARAPGMPLPPSKMPQQPNQQPNQPQQQQPQHAPTVPDEDFFSLIQRIQSGRLEDQRATLPSDKGGGAGGGGKH